MLSFLHHDPWSLSEIERENSASTDSHPPNASTVMVELGLNLAAALAFAFLVCICLSEAGIPSP